MISYFIVSHRTFSTNFSNKLKSRFQVIFGQDSFPLKMSPFQVSLSQSYTNCLLANKWWNTCFYQIAHLSKKAHKLFVNDWAIDLDLWSWDFKVEFSPLQSDIPITLLWLILGVGSISRVLVVLQKTNNAVARCHLCYVLFLRGGIFDKRSVLFVTLHQWVS